MQSPPPPVPSLAGRRADAGTVKLTDRDITGLMLCAEHYGAPYDLLAAALDAATTQDNDPTLLDALPILGDILTGAPARLVEQLLDAFNVQAVYSNDLHQVTIHATLTDATPRPSPACSPTPVPTWPHQRNSPHPSAKITLPVWQRTRGYAQRCCAAGGVHAQVPLHAQETGRGAAHIGRNGGGPASTGRMTD